jgi:hypothetical protein
MSYLKVFFGFELLLLADSCVAQIPVVNRSYEHDKHTCTYTVHIMIHAPKVSGMARYTEFLPEGAKIQVIDKGKAETRTDEGKLKFIWTDFPVGGDLKLAYSIISCQDIFSDYAGQFDFLGTDGSKAVVHLLKENIRESGSRTPVGQ